MDPTLQALTDEIYNCGFRHARSKLLSQTSRYENFGNRTPDQPLNTVSQYMNNTDICWLLRPSYMQGNNIYNPPRSHIQTPATIDLMAEEATKCRHISEWEMNLPKDHSP